LPQRDGVVSSIINFRGELERRGHEVFIFTPGSKKQKEENKDPHIYYFTSAVFKPYPDYRLSLFPFFSARKIVRKIGADLVHSHGIATTGLAAIQCANAVKAPAIASFHTMVPSATHYLTSRKDFQEILEKVAWGYLKWYYGFFRKVIVPSKFTEGILNAHGIQNTVVIPSGIDYGFYSSGNGNRVRKKHGLGRKKVILHVGRVVKEKNLELIINEAQSIINKRPDALFMIVGKGPAEEEYRNLVKIKGLSENFIFTGFVPREELPDYYAAADVFAFPSYFDTQGLVALEAMAAGLPVVAPEKSGSADFIKNGASGYTFQEEVDFREKVLLAIENGKEMGEKGREIAREYDADKRAEELMALYREMLAKK
ncbi:MAG: glycosyltransferase, partial [Candidatus Bilamarchaeaceae archaeon]